MAAISHLKNLWNGLSNYQSNNLENNKAFKSHIWPDPACKRCGRVETMEHLLCECEHYSELLLERLEMVFTQLFNQISTDHVPRVELEPTSVIYNIPHPSFLLYAPDKNYM